jgi:hypothetical protein
LLTGETLREDLREALSNPPSAAAADQGVAKNL